MELRIQFRPTKKQHDAWSRLIDDITTETLFGGGAGGAKTYLGCKWLELMGISYPGSRWVVGRKELKSLKQSTVLTFIEILLEDGFHPMKQRPTSSNVGAYQYNAQDGVIYFWNGTEYYLKDLIRKPSDPNYDDLGSTEYTGGFLDEVNQIEQKAKDVIRSRLRYKLTHFCRRCSHRGLDKGLVTATNKDGKPVEWRCKNCKNNDRGLRPKLLMSCNPAKNWVYQEFYKPWKEDTLQPTKAFIQALVTDNPHISPAYIEELQNIKDPVLRARLLRGDWEYTDDETVLFGIDDLRNLFTNQLKEEKPIKRITCDVARKGSDQTVIIVWKGLEIIEIHTMKVSKTTEVARKIEQLQNIHNISNDDTIVDEDGVGGGVVDELMCHGFVGASRPLVRKKYEGQSEARDAAKKEWKENYQNLRSQCYYTLADYVVAQDISLSRIKDSRVRDMIVEELELVKRRDPDSDSKLKIVSKEDIKKDLGRSPDYADAIMMRMWFEVRPEKKKARGFGHKAI